MFIESTIPSGRRKLPAGIATAVVAHTIAIALLILIPLLQSSQLPSLPPARSCVLTPAPPPPPPPAPRSAAQAQPRTPKPEPTPPEQVKFVAPTEIPDKIPEEPEPNLAVEGGSEFGDARNGVPYGLVDGIPGGAGPAPEPAQPIRVGGAIPRPRLLKRVEPKYPQIAVVARVQGTVIIEATTDVTGHVVDVRVLKSIALLDGSARDAVRQWVYEPMVLDGRPQPVIFTVTVEFVLK